MFRNFDSLSRFPFPLLPNTQETIVADTVDAIISDRPYRRGQPLTEAREGISSVGGVQFDPEIVQRFERVPDERIEYLQIRYRDREPAVSEVTT